MKIQLNSSEVAEIVANHLAKQKGESQAYSISLVKKNRRFSDKEDWFLDCIEINDEEYNRIKNEKTA